MSKISSMKHFKSKALPKYTIVIYNMYVYILPQPFSNFQNKIKVALSFEVFKLAFVGNFMKTCEFASIKK